MWRGLAVAVVVLCFPVSGSSSAKERRQWVDPPSDLVTGVAPQRDSTSRASDELEVEASDSLEASPQNVAAPSSLPLVISPTPRPPCTTRSYTMLSGATVRVHTC
jgi:hypothetical protein